MASTQRLTSIEASGRSIIDIARAEPDRIVDQYPTWRLSDLLAHVASVHGRTARICRELPSTRVDGPARPPDRDLYGWAAAILDEMLEALQAADPGARVWTFVADGRLDFWERRMVIETGVHGWDAQRAVGGTDPLPSFVAASGLDEFSAMYLPRLGAVPTIELVDPELDRRWRYGDGPPTAVISGSASDHFLRLMQRPGTRLPAEWEAAVDALDAPAKPESS